MGRFLVTRELAQGLAQNRGIHGWHKIGAWGGFQRFGSFSGHARCWVSRFCREDWVAQGLAQGLAQNRGIHTSIQASIRVCQRLAQNGGIHTGYPGTGFGTKSGYPYGHPGIHKSVPKIGTKWGYPYGQNGGIHTTGHQSIQPPLVIATYIEPPTATIPWPKGGALLRARQPTQNVFSIGLTS